MSRQAYLTIDDSPTRHTDDLTDWLVARGIPAVFFAIGSAYTDLDFPCEGIEQNPAPMVRAIEKGFVVGNHTYTHRRSSELTYEDVVEEIQKTEKLIDGLYKQAGKARPCKMIRFPHLDRGCGGWIVDYKKAQEQGYDLLSLFDGGLNIMLDPPSDEQVEKKKKIQEFLAGEGFTTAPFTGVTFDWYQDTEMADARDALYTFSTSDWMINPDFASYNKDWAYHSLDELKGKIDNDPWMNTPGSVHIVLAHDHNNLFEGTTALIDHMQQGGMKFIEVKA